MYRRNENPNDEEILMKMMIDDKLFVLGNGRAEENI
jgi:hypothetical protein